VFARSGGTAAALVVALVTGVVVSTGAVSVAHAVEYPTWDDVQNAKQNEASTNAEITRIETIINGLETEAADFARESLELAELYNQARDALDVATARAAALQEQADAAEAEAQVSATRAGQLVAQLTRTGGGDVTLALLLSGGEADTLLYRLTAMNKLTEHSGSVYDRATQDTNTADSLTAQASVAREARVGLETEAQAALVEAQQAADQAEARLATQQTASAQLYAQLGSLKGTTAATEQQYLEGLAWEAAQNAIKNPPPPAPPVNPPPAAPNGNAVAGAIAFAKAQLGDHYQFGGAGPDVWDCSGLTKMSYASVGVYIGTHSAGDQYNTMANAGRLVPLAGMVAGDLLFYSNGGAPGGSKYHVTMYLGDGQMIEAPRPGALVRIMPVRYGDLVPYAGRPTS
jgi:cell wall-associated NlpC family hydrolase